MQRSLSVLLALVLLFSTVGLSADFQKGLEAYEEKDYKTALRRFKPLAEKGHADAQYHLGLMYAKGRGVPQNDETAMKWYRLAGKRGHAEAQYHLGRIYDKGYDVPQNYRTAVKWYRLAAEQGYISAQYLLGIMYEEGKGVPQDNVYAHMWYNVCASQGSGYAAHHREVIQGKMIPSEIQRAQDLASECLEKKHKGCDRPK